MAQDETSEAENARKRAGISEAERREALTALLLRRSKLSAREAVLLREVFPAILAAHHDQVSERLRKRGLAGDEVEDLVQEIFLALYAHILEDGFPDSLPSMLHLIMQRKFLNHVRGRMRIPESIALPSSGSEKPRSEPEVERALELGADGAYRLHVAIQRRARVDHDMELTDRSQIANHGCHASALTSRAAHEDRGPRDA